MAPTIRIVSLRVGRRKGHPIPDRPTRRDPIPGSTRTLRMQRAASRSFIPYRTENPARTARAEAAGTNGAEGMGKCRKRRKDTSALPFPHDVHRGGSAPWRAKNKRSAGSSSAPPPAHPCASVFPGSQGNRHAVRPHPEGRGCGRTATKKRTAVVPAALRALSVSAGRPCESAFTISTDACVRSRRE